MEKTNNTLGVTLFCEKYLNKKNIEYKAFSWGDDERINGLKWEENGIKFSSVIDDDYAIVSGNVPELFCDNENLWQQVKQYVHRCNNYNGLVWFDFYEMNKPEIRVSCGFGKYFSVINMEDGLLGGYEEIKKMIKTFAAGIYEVAEGKDSAEEIFKKYSPKSEDEDFEQESSFLFDFRPYRD